MDIKTIGVVGAGTMGNGIAQVFAQAGLDVQLVDVARPMLDRARGTIEKSLGKFVEKGTLTSADRDATLGRLSMKTSLEGLREADFVVEAIVENVDAKRALFASLDGIVKAESILASNTSSISITTIAAATARPSRVLGMHFMNPVPLMPLVELIAGYQTSPDSMRTASELCVRLGKTPVEAADSPGFIANRVLMPMINEAIFAVMEGVGTPDAIDTVMKLDESPDGASRARRLHRPRRVPGDPQRAARGPGRSEVPRLSVATPDGRRGATRSKVGPGLLRVLTRSPPRAGGGSAFPTTSRSDSSARSPR